MIINLPHKSMLRFLLLLTLASTIATQKNFQERAIYLGPDDNPCIYSAGGQLDAINLIIDL